MSPFPGAPKSQQSPAINKPSTRYPSTLNEHSTMGEVAGALRSAFNGLTVHEQAFAALPAQIAGQASSAATQAVTNYTSSQTVQGVNSFNTQSGAVIYFPGLGTVNDQRGVVTYVTQSQDNGAKIIVGDSSAVTVTMNSSVNSPWFTIIDNDSSAITHLIADSGTTGALVGQSYIAPNCFGIVFYDGRNFWSGSTPIATDSGLGIVRPDNATIRVDSGIFSTIGATGTIHLRALTDSGATGQIYVAHGLIMSFSNPT